MKISKPHWGFTLIEVMVVVAIVGILAAIAIPSYQDYVIRSRITQATSGLAARRVLMEQYYQDHHAFSSAACSISSVPGDLFTFDCSAVDAVANTYTLTASGQGFTYTVDQANARSTTAVPSGWTTNAKCWVTRKGGAC